MSNKSINPNHDDQSEWQPLIPEQEKSFRTAALNKTSSAILHEKNSFKPLYEGTEKQGPSGDFKPLYTRQKKMKPSSPANPNEAVETAIEPDSTSKERIEKDDIEKRKKDAHEQGFTQGKKDGYESGIQEANQRVEGLSQIMSALDDLWHQMVSRYENEMIELVKRISEKVIYGHTQIDNEIVKRAILKSFELIPDPTEATINVSTEDYEFIETAKEDLFQQIKSLKNVSIVADPSLSRGGCRVETKAGDVDSDIENRLEAISKSIIDAANEIADEQ